MTAAERAAPQPALELVVADLLAARKYRDLAPALLRRVAREALAVAPRRVDALQRAKTKLHQLHSAFLPARALAGAEALVARLTSDASPAEIETVCAQLLARHASTHERPRALAPLYRDLFALTGAPTSVLDLGCGLHPFALPWMALPRDVAYHAVDVDRRMLALIATLFRRIGQRGDATAADLLGDEPLPRADVAFAMKLLPTLERQQAGAAARLLDRIEVRALVLSFPTASLGRRAKGMAGHYRELAERLLAPRGWPARTLATPSEIFFVVTPPPRPR